MAETQRTFIRCRSSMRLTLTVMSLVLMITHSLPAADTLVSIDPDAATGTAAAVLVGDVPLVHTAQLFPDDLAAGDEVQMKSVLSELNSTLRRVGSDLDQCVKLNVYLAHRKLIPVVQSEIARQFHGQHKPAVSFIVTALPDLRSRVAIDAVAATGNMPARSVQVFPAAGSRTGGISHPAVSVIPDGTRIYISGQAARHASLAEATRSTLTQILGTLQFLGRRRRDVVQVRCFLQPMASARMVRNEIAVFFGDQPEPPVSLVEWQSGLRVPIEIEVVAFGGKNRTGSVVEYLTPPGMKASPVFSRIVRINHSKSIYISGVHTAGKTLSGDAEVEQVFDSLERVLKKSGSGLRHLVKATYLVSSDAASRALNKLRPKFYDPVRPPAASKARVADTGHAGCGLMLDMIAVPAVESAVSEYGPAESGYGLSPESAMNSWISLFDGRTTFGWTGSSVAEGLIFGGQTTSEFLSIEIQAESATSGMLQFGKQSFPVDGEFSATVEAVPESRAMPIRLDAGLQLKWLAIRPLKGESLVPGHDLAGWKALQRDSVPVHLRPRWNVSSGTVHVSGGPGCLEFQDRQFGDFILQLDVRTRRRHANGGIFFRAIRGDVMNGYEAQIFNRSSNGDPARPARWCTGGIDDRRNARRMISRDGRFFRMTIIARGPHIATWVNGSRQVDWTDMRRPHLNPREGLRVTPGTIQLQAHDVDTDIEFRRIVISDL